MKDCSLDEFLRTKQANAVPNIRPVGNRILVEPIWSKSKRSKNDGIIFPDAAAEAPMECLVLALGTAKVDDDGNAVPFGFRKGDRVLVHKDSGTEIKLDGKTYRILGSDDVLAVVD